MDHLRLLEAYLLSTLKLPVNNEQNNNKEKSLHPQLKDMKHISKSKELQVKTGLEGTKGKEDYSRSPSDGASISHTSPWSQPFPE